MGKFLIVVASALAASFICIAAIAGAPFPASGVSFLASGDPLIAVSLCALCFALASFVAGIVTKDYSWVDRLWSTLPVLFAWYYAYRGGFSLPILAAALLVTAWGARLTANFAKKGGYAGTEDYRWSVLRDRIRNPLAWQAFNLGFISLFQVGTFVLFTLPLRRMAMEPAAPGTANLLFFALACALMAGAVVIEGIADAEQWKFQEAKRRFRAGERIDGRFEEDAARGFRTTGLFALSRHPNYFGELMTWLSLYLMSAALNGTSLASAFLHWSAAGILVLVVLFIGSTIFTESITSSKYPAYEGYKKRVSAIIPWFPGKRG